jgi:prepilin-type processing-associated H-X9-DG protein
MKPRLSKQPTTAFTLMELLVVIAVLFILLALVDFGPSPSAKKQAQRIICVNNLKQIGVAYRLWEGNHGDKYPMVVSVTNGGAMELIATGNVAACFQVMSNEMSTPKILLCLADTHRVLATNFATLNRSNISYFVNLDAVESYPQMLLDGDDNLTVGGVRVRPGILNLGTNTTIGWTKERHNSGGIIGLADGSVQQLTTDGLRQAFQQTGVATNRLAIP